MKCQLDVHHKQRHVDSSRDSNVGVKCKTYWNAFFCKDKSMPYKNKENVKKYNEEHKKEIREKARQYYQKHKEVLREKHKKYNEEHREEAKIYYKEHKESIKKYLKEHIEIRRIREINKRKENIEFKIISNLRSRLYQAVKNKSNSTLNLVGCFIPDLMKYLEQQFTEGMSWDNYGKWHIDHIRPCASFNLLNEDEQKACFHYSNLQPLWAIDNIKKGDKIKI